MLKYFSFTLQYSHDNIICVVFILVDWEAAAAENIFGKLEKLIRSRRAEIDSAFHSL